MTVVSRLAASLCCAAIVTVCAGCGEGGDEPEKEPRAAEPDCLRSADAPRPRSGDEPRAIYRKLRSKALRVDPSEIGLRPTADLPRVFGVMMETGYPEGCATLLALADGTTSLYLSPGGGFIGGGERPEIAATSKRFVRAAEEALDQLPPSRSESLPVNGRVVIRALTYDGHHVAEASEDDLGYDRHELSPLFYAGQDVITRLRQTDEAGR